MERTCARRGRARSGRVVGDSADCARHRYHRDAATERQTGARKQATGVRNHARFAGRLRDGGEHAAGTKLRLCLSPWRCLEDRPQGGRRRTAHRRRQRRPQDVYRSRARTRRRGAGSRRQAGDSRADRTTLPARRLRRRTERRRRRAHAADRRGGLARSIRRLEAEGQCRRKRDGIVDPVRHLRRDRRRPSAANLRRARSAGRGRRERSHFGLLAFFAVVRWPGGAGGLPDFTRGRVADVIGPRRPTWRSLHPRWLWQRRLGWRWGLRRRRRWRWRWVQQRRWRRFLRRRRRWRLVMGIGRLLKHIFVTPGALHRAFPRSTRERIREAIAATETRHSGEIRFAMEAALPWSYLRRDAPARQ